MRCKKCHIRLPPFARYCSGCGTHVELEQRLKAEFSILLAIALIVSGVLGASYLLGDALRVPSLSGVVMTAAIAVMVLGIAFVVLFLFAFIDLVRFALHKPKFIPLPLLTLLLVAFGGYAISRSTEYSRTAVSLPLLQYSLTEAAASELMGDRLAEGKSAPSGYSWWKVQSSSQRTAQIVSELSVPGNLQDYKKSILVWVAKMADVSKDPKGWSSIPSEPGSFNLSINDSRARSLFASSLQEISALKEFGDTAIKNKDTQTLRYIAARLLVQKHWLHGLASSDDPGFFALLPIPAAHAAEPRGVCAPEQDGKTICLDVFLNIVDELYRSALDVLAAKEGAEIAWETAWKSAQEKGLVTYALAEDAKYSPTVQAFVDDCYGLGGELGDKPASRDRIMTDEAGYVCSFLRGSNKCWQMLTYSGVRYSSGDRACPQENVITASDAAPWSVEPEAEKTKSSQPSTKTPQPTKPKAVSWDGTYHVTGKMDCSGDIADLPPSIPVDTQISIVGNTITDASGKKNQIDAQGRATLSGTTSVEGLTMAYRTDYRFQMENGVATARGTATAGMSALSGTTTYTAHCAGAVTGVRTN